MENEVKNTKPTVSSDTDSLGRTHNRSYDGKFTAGDYQNKLLDSNFSVPYFENFVKPVLIQNFYPGLDIIPGSKKQDGQGIDYLVVDKDQNIEETFDLKTETSAFGTDIYDDDTNNIALNLYKMDKNNNNWLEGSHLNKTHLNDGYVFLFIDTFDDKIQIFNQINNGARMEDIPNVYGCRAICAPKKELDQYINERILLQDHVKSVIENQKQYIGYPEDDFPFDSFPKNVRFRTDKEGYINYISYRFPVAGESDIKATIKAYRQHNGSFAIRLFVPNKIFEQTSLKDLCEILDIDR